MIIKILNKSEYSKSICFFNSVNKICVITSGSKTSPAFSCSYDAIKYVSGVFSSPFFDKKTCCFIKDFECSVEQASLILFGRDYVQDDFEGCFFVEGTNISLKEYLINIGNEEPLKKKVIEAFDSKFIPEIQFDFNELNDLKKKIQFLSNSKKYDIWFYAYCIILFANSNMNVFEEKNDEETKFYQNLSKICNLNDSFLKSVNVNKMYETIYDLFLKFDKPIFKSKTNQNMYVQTIFFYTYNSKKSIMQFIKIMLDIYYGDLEGDISDLDDLVNDVYEDLYRSINREGVEEKEFSYGSTYLLEAAIKYGLLNNRVASLYLIKEIFTFISGKSFDTYYNEFSSSTLYEIFNREYLEYCKVNEKKVINIKSSKEYLEQTHSLQRLRILYHYDSSADSVYLLIPSFRLFDKYDPNNAKYVFRSKGVGGVAKSFEFIKNNAISKSRVVKIKLSKEDLVDLTKCNISIHISGFDSKDDFDYESDIKNSLKREMIIFDNNGNEASRANSIISPGDYYSYFKDIEEISFSGNIRYQKESDFIYSIYAKDDSFVSSNLFSIHFTYHPSLKDFYIDYNHIKSKESSLYIEDTNGIRYEVHSSKHVNAFIILTNKFKKEDFNNLIISRSIDGDFANLTDIISLAKLTEKYEIKNDRVVIPLTEFIDESLFNKTVFLGLRKLPNVRSFLSVSCIIFGDLSCNYNFVNDVFNHNNSALSVLFDDYNHIYEINNEINENVLEDFEIDGKRYNLIFNPFNVWWSINNGNLFNKTQKKCVYYKSLTNNFELEVFYNSYYKDEFNLAAAYIEDVEVKPLAIGNPIKFPIGKAILDNRFENKEHFPISFSIGSNKKYRVFDVSTKINCGDYDSSKDSYIDSFESPQLVLNFLKYFVGPNKVTFRIDFINEESKDIVSKNFDEFDIININDVPDGHYRFKIYYEDLTNPFVQTEYIEVYSSTRAIYFGNEDAILYKFDTSYEFQYLKYEVKGKQGKIKKFDGYLMFNKFICYNDIDYPTYSGVYVTNGYEQPVQIVSLNKNCVEVFFINNDKINKANIQIKNGRLVNKPADNINIIELPKINIKEDE